MGSSQLSCPTKRGASPRFVCAADLTAHCGDQINAIRGFSSALLPAWHDLLCAFIPLHSIRIGIISQYVYNQPVVSRFAY